MPLPIALSLVTVHLCDATARQTVTDCASRLVMQVGLLQFAWKDGGTGGTGGSGGGSGGALVPSGCLSLSDTLLCKPRLLRRFLSESAATMQVGAPHLMAGAGRTRRNARTTQKGSAHSPSCLSPFT